MIKIYSKNNCGACLTVKSYITQHGLVENEHFSYINTDDAGNEQHKEYVFANYMGFPVVEYKGIKFTGFDVEKLNQIISEVNKD